MTKRVANFVKLKANSKGAGWFNIKLEAHINAEMLTQLIQLINPEETTKQ